MFEFGNNYQCLEVAQVLKDIISSSKERSYSKINVFRKNVRWNLMNENLFLEYFRKTPFNASLKIEMKQLHIKTFSELSLILTYIVSF